MHSKSGIFIEKKLCTFCQSSHHSYLFTHFSKYKTIFIIHSLSTYCLDLPFERQLSLLKHHPELTHDKNLEFEQNFVNRISKLTITIFRHVFIDLN
jgi:hypothetical protein